MSNKYKPTGRGSLLILRVSFDKACFYLGWLGRHAPGKNKEDSTEVCAAVLQNLRGPSPNFLATSDFHEKFQEVLKSHRW